MEQLLTSVLHQLNQISVRGDDVERLAVAKHMLRQLQAVCDKLKDNPPSERKELSHNE